jgi:hypothetical protein
MSKIMKSYCAGRSAAATGAALSDNPHPAGHAEHGIWADGWRSYGFEAVQNTKDICDYPKGGGFSLSVGSGTLALNAATGTITATVEQNGIATENIALAAESSDEAICTVAGDDETDENGEVDFTVTRVANGAATVTISTTLGTMAAVAVTATGAT